jgi:hypothetical protein
MPTTPAYIKGSLGKLATLSIGGATVVGTPSTSFTQVGGITDIQAEGMKLGTVTTTDLSSNVVRRLGTTLDFQTISLTTKNASSDSGQTAVVAAQIAGVPYDFEIIYNDNDAAKTVTVGFSALVTQAGAIDLEEDKVNTSKIELSIDGAWTITTAAIA